MANKKGKHCRTCKRDFPTCPCLTCVNDNYKGDNVVEKELCCGTKDHKGKFCGWTECPDYECEVKDNVNEHMG